MLPALGFAILLKQIVQEPWMIVLFVLGWVLMVSISMTTTALVFVAIAIAVLFVLAKDQKGRVVESEEEGI